MFRYMESISFSVHPLFFLFGLYYSLTGRIIVFTVYTLTAVIHEIGHSICASRQGFYLKKITLMPFGAVISGETSEMSSKDELKIAFAGPITNLLIGLFFVALWWIFPAIYVFTDIIVVANFSLAIINLLPFFPLDGGRILLCLFSEKYGRKTSLKICKILGFIGGGILFLLFIVSLFSSPNFSLLFFSLFIVFGNVGKNKENGYVKLYSFMKEERIKRGMAYRKIAIDKETTVKKLITLLDGEYLNEVVVFYQGKSVITLSPNEVDNLIFNADIYKPVSFYLKNALLNE